MPPHLQLLLADAVEPERGHQRSAQRRVDYEREQHVPRSVDGGLLVHALREDSGPDRLAPCSF